MKDVQVRSVQRKDSVLASLLRIRICHLGYTYLPAITFLPRPMPLRVQMVARTLCEVLDHLLPHRPALLSRLVLPTLNPRKSGYGSMILSQAIKIPHKSPKKWVADTDSTGTLLLSYFANFCKVSSLLLRITWHVPANSTQLCLGSSFLCFEQLKFFSAPFAFLEDK